MASKTLTWGGVASSTIAGFVIGKRKLSLIGARRSQLQSVPGRAGFFMFDEEPGERLLSYSCYALVGDMDDREAKVSEIAAWYSAVRSGDLLTDEYSDRYYEAHLGSPSDPDEWRHKASFDLSWIVGPYLLATAASNEILAAIGAGSDSGSFVIPDSIYAEPVIEITPNNGTITAFTLTIEGVAMTYSAPTIASGNTLAINTISDTVTTGVSGDVMLTGAYNPANLVMGFVSGAFPILKPGSNNWSLVWSGTATNITIDITWRRRYA